jgi:hypothetical protein
MQIFFYLNHSDQGKFLQDKTRPRTESTLPAAEEESTDRKLPSRTKDRTVTLLSMFRLETTD